MTRHVMAGLVAAALAVAGCRRHSSSYSRAGDDPHDTDSLYVLYHRILTDSDPVTVWSETGCAMYRLMDRLGPEQAVRRIHAFTDTVYTAAEQRRRNEIEPKLWFHDYPQPNSSCGDGMGPPYVPGGRVDRSGDSARPRP